MLRPMGHSLLSHLAKLREHLIARLRTRYQVDAVAEIRVPVLVDFTGACESVESVMHVVSRPEAVLTQTGQLALERALEEIPGVWCHTGSYRSELEDERHLREFELVEEELTIHHPIMGEAISNARGSSDSRFDVLLARIETVMRELFTVAATTCSDDIRALGGDPDIAASIAEGPFARLTYDAALTVLKDAGTVVAWGKDLTPADEQILLTSLQSEVGYPQPLFITHFPADIKFFNMRVSSQDSRVVESADLLLPGGGETVGAAVREDRHEGLVDRFESLMWPRLAAAGVPTSARQAFTDYFVAVRDKRLAPHAGYGIGLERVMLSILGGGDIRHVSIPWLLTHRVQPVAMPLR